MIIRYADDGDLGDIVNLFKTSLGKLGGQPEINFWRWKHEQNPFGKSPILLAFDGDTLVGLRTFLQWRFLYQGQSLRAYRAVDTATHPAYRGKGIFKRLTMALIDDLKKGEPSFIFNTPNNQSLPGYLKMGWRMLGKTPLRVRPLPIQIIRNRFVTRTYDPTPTPWPVEWEDAWNEMAPLIRDGFKNVISTDVSVEYLKWRYLSIPGFTYQVHVRGNSDDCCILFYRVKKSGFLCELRITDLFTTKSNTSWVKKSIHELVELYKPDVISIVEDNERIISSLLPIGFLKAKYFGLQVTYREVNSHLLSQLVANEKLWYFNAGLIELL